MFRGKKKYAYFNRKGSECIEDFSEEKDFIVQFASGYERFYIKFDSCNSFYTWYKDVPAFEKCFFEVIRDGRQKFKIDIDEKVKDISSYVCKIRSILEECGIGGAKMIIFDIETSYHIVVSNYFFNSYRHCKLLAMALSREIKMDMGVYSRVQHFRIEGCTKPGQRRWKKRMYGTVSIENFHEGIISHTEGTKLANMAIESSIPRRVYHTVVSGIPPDFKIRFKEGSLTVLDRTRPSYCRQCRRIHDHENAYMVGKRFFCRRFYSE
jgi:hypothetical protein